MRGLSTRGQVQLGVGLTLLWLFVVLGLPSGPIKIALSSAYMLCVPGFLMYRLFRGARTLPTFWETLGYSVGLSSLNLMVIGLVVNFVLPIFGMNTPLSVLPISIAIAATTLLLLRQVWRAGYELIPHFDRPNISVPALWLAYAGVSTVVLSVLGAISLNNGGTNAFTIAMLSTICVVSLALPWAGKRLSRNAIGFGLYLMSLAMLFATSLRGWFITGHDVMQEYQVFEITSKHSLWSMNFFHDPYNACLSITILPTVLQRMTGISDPYVYKVLIQIIFALVPVLVYLLASRIIPLMAAAIVGLIYITFPTFMMDFPMLNRQEMAFLFFVLSMMAVFEYGLKRSVRLALVLALFGGMVLSHYSTSYIAVGAIILFKLIETGIRGWRILMGKRPRPLLRLSWLSVLVLAGMVYIWNVPMTNTAGQAESTLASIETSLPSLLHHTQGPQLSGTALFNAYVQSAPLTRDLSADNYYPASVTKAYPPVETSAPSAPLTHLGEALSQVGIPVGMLLDLSKTLYGLMIEGLIVAGLVVVSLRKSWKIRHAYLIFGIAFFALIVLQVLLPNAINYGLLRLMQQGLIFLALPMLSACYYGAQLLRIPEKYRLPIISALFTIGFAMTCGLAAALTGGYPQQLVAANSGFYYDAYYTHADEIAGFNWLYNFTPTGSIVDSDEFTRRKMATYVGIYPRVAITPSTIATDGYFFMSYGNVTTNTMPHYFNGSLIYQIPPTAFLQANKNLLYTNGDVQIYR